MKQILLAYSGGLDTTVILKWLIESGYDVSCFIADLGQKDDFDAIKRRAQTIGAKEVFIEDLKETFLFDYIFPALFANATYEGKYLLGTALARPLIASSMVKTARNSGIDSLAHGATGKGNDQVRFELVFNQMYPEVKIIAPWRDDTFLNKFQGRDDLLNFLENTGIEFPAKKTPYSRDANLMHISCEGGDLEHAHLPPREEMFQLTVSPKNAPDEITQIALEFHAGIPKALEILNTGQRVENAFDVFNHLQEIAGKNGIGRTDIVESRIIGIKSRGVYEAPAATVLWTAHKDLENMTLQGDVIKQKSKIEIEVADLIYKGLWFSPEMQFLMSSIKQTQEFVNGKVFLDLTKGR